MVVKNKKKYVLQQYFIPRERYEEKIKEDNVPYDKWEENGWVTVCDGSMINFSDVTAWFYKLHTEHDITCSWVGYDPWGAKYWIKEMDNTGFVMEQVIQGAKTMSNPMKELEADLRDKKINYNNNPVLKWCLLNTAIETDKNDNIRPVKGRKSKQRIDGTVSLIDAYVVLLRVMDEYLTLQGE